MGSPAYPRPLGLPALNPKQVEALDAIEKIARATELQIRTEPGDIHMINNLAIFHRRDSFVNGDSVDQKRHLVRMQLRDSRLGWKIPPELDGEWTGAFKGDREKMWHVEPMPEGFFPMRLQPN